jgi:uncharacterized membrane protein
LPKWWPWLVLGLLVVAYTVTSSVLSINNHLGFNTGRADLGFYVSIFRRSSLGDLLGCTICGGGNHLSGHFDPVLVLLSPLYLLHPEAETVLILQSFLLGSTMIPLYMIGRQLRLPAAAALALCACFGLHPALHGINLFDFHSLALVVPGAMWLLWAREAERWRLYWLFVVLFLTIREDAALILVIVGAVASALRAAARAANHLRGRGVLPCHQDVRPRWPRSAQSRYGPRLRVLLQRPRAQGHGDDGPGQHRAQ